MGEFSNRAAIISKGSINVNKVLICLLYGCYFSNG